jgi:hypothetical protein
MAEIAAAKMVVCRNRMPHGWARSSPAANAKVARARPSLRPRTASFTWVSLALARSSTGVAIAPLSQSSAHVQTWPRAWGG